MKLHFQILTGILLFVEQVSSQACLADGQCDTHERCTAWKEEGECVRNADYMRKHCPATCSEPSATTANQKDCVDTHPRCFVWAELGECDTNPEMSTLCPQSCNTCPMAASVDCIDAHELCSFWADKGECSNNPTVSIVKNLEWRSVRRSMILSLLTPSSLCLRTVHACQLPEKLWYLRQSC